jgi:S1-C subfamily serine protease
MNKIFSTILFLLIGFIAASIFYIQFYPIKTNTQAQNVERQTVVYEDSVITKVVKNSLPSVVTIAINNGNNSSNSPLGFNQLNPLNLLVPGQLSQQSPNNNNQNIGSGFIVSSDGLIITSKHVVADIGISYEVITNDNKTYQVVDIYRDPLNDLAILKINTSGLQPLTLANSSQAQLGQLVIAIGTPLGQFQNTVTQGIVSGLGRQIVAGSPFAGSVETLNNVIQTDAAINAGNSGGPLLNAEGQVIGVNTAVASASQDIDFAIPSNSVATLINNFKQNGSSFSQPYLGIRYQIVNKQQAILNNVAQGAYVADVISGSPADDAGIQVGDVITSFDNKSLQTQDTQALTKLIQQKKVGDTVTLTIWRNNQTLTKKVVLQNTP